MFVPWSTSHSQYLAPLECDKKHCIFAKQKYWWSFWNDHLNGIVDYRQSLDDLWSLWEFDKYGWSGCYAIFQGFLCLMFVWICMYYDFVTCFVLSIPCWCLLRTMPIPIWMRSQRSMNNWFKMASQAEYLYAFTQYTPSKVCMGNHPKETVRLSSHKVTQNYLPGTLPRFLVTLVGTNFKADIDFSSSSISMSHGGCSSGSTLAGTFDWEAELRRRNLPSKVEDVESRRLWLFMGRSIEVCLSIPSFTI